MKKIMSLILAFSFIISANLPLVYAQNNGVDSRYLDQKIQEAIQQEEYWADRVEKIENAAKKYLAEYKAQGLSPEEAEKKTWEKLKKYKYIGYDLEKFDAGAWAMCAGLALYVAGDLLTYTSAAASAAWAPTLMSASGFGVWAVGVLLVLTSSNIPNGLDSSSMPIKEKIRLLKTDPSLLLRNGGINPKVLAEMIETDPFLDEYINSYFDVLAYRNHYDLLPLDELRKRMQSYPLAERTVVNETMELGNIYREFDVYMSWVNSGGERSVPEVYEAFKRQNFGSQFGFGKKR